MSVWQTFPEMTAFWDFRDRKLVRSHTKNNWSYASFDTNSPYFATKLCQFPIKILFTVPLQIFYERRWPLLNPSRPFFDFLSLKQTRNIKIEMHKSIATPMAIKITILVRSSSSADSVDSLNTGHKIWTI